MIKGRSPERIETQKNTGHKTDAVKTPLARYQALGNVLPTPSLITKVKGWKSISQWRRC